MKEPKVERFSHYSLLLLVHLERLSNISKKQIEVCYNDIQFTTLFNKNIRLFLTQPRKLNCA